MSSHRSLAAREPTWAAYFRIEDDDDRREIFEALFGLLEDPSPPTAEPAILNYHGTESDGCYLTLCDGRVIVPYQVTPLPSGREVIRILLPIYVEW